MAARFSSQHILLLSGGWLATALIAFSLGRLGSAESGGPADRALSEAPVQAVNAGGSTNVATLFEARDIRSRAGAQETVEQVTGGEPLGDWIKRLASVDDEIVRTETFLRLLGALNTPEELRAALDALKEASEAGRFRGGFGMREASMVLQKWTQLDAKGAIEYARSADGRDRWMAASVVMGAWARLNPDEALAHAQNNPLPMGNDDGNWSLASVVAQFARSDLDRALQLAGGQEESRARGVMMEAILSELVSQRGEDAARAAVLSLPAGSFRDSMASQLARRLAEKDGPGTAEWVLSALPAGDAQNGALANTIGQWVRNDPIAAGQFLSRLPASEGTDGARERYALGVVAADPEGALLWAGTITDAKQRSRAVENLFNSWVRRDKAAAQKWAVTAQLPEDLRAKLLRN